MVDFGGNFFPENGSGDERRQNKKRENEVVVGRTNILDTTGALWWGREGWGGSYCSGKIFLDQMMITNKISVKETQNEEEEEPCYLKNVA